MEKIAAFASGNGSNFEQLVKNGIKIELLICNKQSAYVIKRAEKLGIKYFVVTTKGRAPEQFEAEMLSILKEHEITFIVLAGYMRVVGKTLLDEYEGRMLNIHPSLLPAFKGAHAIEDAFAFGVCVSGVTVHLVDSNLDEGTIVMQKPVIIESTDTLETFEAKIHDVEYELFHKAIKKVLKEQKNETSISKC